MDAKSFAVAGQLFRTNLFANLFAESDTPPARL
jgi:hypothetical protein